MTLSERLVEYISACFTGLWVESHEHDDALREIAQMCRQRNWAMATWSIDQGLQIPGGNMPTDAGGNDPLSAIRSINALASPEGSAVLVLVNFHRFLGSPEVIQALAHQIAAGKLNRTFIVILSPLVQVPTELEKLFVIVEHDLPDRAQLEEIARGIATEDGELPEAEALETVLDAAAGLTRYEAEGAFSLSLVRHQHIQADSVWELKAGMLKKSGLLQLYRGGERFDALGGLQALKTFCLRSMRNQGHRDPLRRPRGVMLLSPAGCGKSQFAKCLGNEMGRPTLIFDVGSLYGSLVGQTEGNIRNQAVSFWRSLSLPYPEPGLRLIRQDRIETFAAQMTQFQEELTAAVQSLDRHYSELKASARQKLGYLYNPADYPDSLVGMFEIAFDFPSVEPPDYLRQLNPELYQEECRRVAARFDEAVRLAEEAFVAELARLVSHLTERLNGTEDGKPKIFRDSAVANLQEFFERFRSLNVRSSDQLDQLVSQCRQIVQGIEPQDLRDRQNLRQQVATELSRVQSVLDGLLVDRPRRRILRSPK